jgi:hypothetical protein
MAFGLDDLLKKAGDMLEQAKDVVADKLEDLSQAAEEKVAELGNSDIVTQAKAKFEEVKDAAGDKMDELTNSDMLAQAKAKFNEVSDTVGHHVDTAKDMVADKIKDLTGDDSKPAA